MRKFLVCLFVLASALAGQTAQARPARVILLRHGEKKNSAELCDVGRLRARALAGQYLGKGAPGADAIFGKGKTPDAFFAVTMHTRETAAPSAESWGKQPVVFSVPPKDPNEDADLDARTREAAAALNSAEYDGKIVVIVWEHKHIAKKSLNKTGDTFWTLLNLGDISDAAVPNTWEGGNYDYIWIVDYANPPPTFTAIQQVYGSAAYAEVPNNAWGEDAEQSKFPEFYRDCKQ